MTHRRFLNVSDGTRSAFRSERPTSHIAADVPFARVKRGASADVPYALLAVGYELQS